jgi:hypothetical protein
MLFLPAFFTSPGSGIFDRLADTRIGATAAEYSAHGIIYIGIRGLWVACQQSNSGKYLA